MCGIAGEFVWKGQRPLVPGELFDMLEAIAHRGPEGAGYWLSSDRRALIMHARLAFVDVAGGIQPMANEDASLWLTFNGELYGYKDMTARLKRAGHRFASRCDAEVAVHLFEDHGQASFAKLNGEFAFAICNARTHELFLVRDRFGIKPLFYHLSGDSIIFGSEAKAVLSHPKVEARLGRAHLRRSLLGLALPDESLFEGIRQVRPGHVLHVSAAGIEERAYWRLAFGAQQAWPSLDAAAERFRQLIDEAVRLRLEADVEIGAYLSGGLDSATLVESITRQTSQPVKTFTIRFADEAGDEARMAARVAAELGAVNYPVDVDGAGLAGNFAACLWHSEQIAMNAHGTAKFMLAAACHTHVKAVITGEGSDDLFAGYAMFSHQHLLEAQRRGGKVEGSLKSLLGRHALLPGLAPAGKYRRHGAVSGILGTYPYQALRAAMIERLMRPLLAPDMAAGLSLEAELQRLADWLPAEQWRGLDPVRASQLTWLACELPSYLLSSLGDRPEMAHSVEGRLPFLDNAIADFALALPPAMLSDQGNGKLVIRRAMGGRLPAAITAERKRVFWVPPQREDAILKGEACRSVLAWRHVRDSGLFDAGKLVLARHLLALVPRASRLGLALRMLLMTAASVHLLEDQFVGDFRASRARFACTDRQWSLDDLRHQPPQGVHAPFQEDRA